MVLAHQFSLSREKILKNPGDTVNKATPVSILNNFVNRFFQAAE
jgi:hypothetical protein